MYVLMYMMWMAKSYSVASARAKLSEIVDAVEGGEDVALPTLAEAAKVVVANLQE